MCSCPVGAGRVCTDHDCVPVRLERVGYVLIMCSCPVGAGRVRIDHVFLSGWSWLGTY